MLVSCGQSFWQAQETWILYTGFCRGQWTNPCICSVAFMPWEEEWADKPSQYAVRSPGSSPVSLRSEAYKRFYNSPGGCGGSRECWQALDFREARSSSKSSRGSCQPAKPSESCRILALIHLLGDSLRSSAGPISIYTNVTTQGAPKQTAYPRT